MDGSGTMLRPCPISGRVAPLRNTRAGRMDDRKRVAGIIRDHIARERISREQLAFKTKLGKSTVDKLLVGLFSDRTLAIVEGQTGLPLRAPPAAQGGVGPIPAGPKPRHEVTFHHSSDGVSLAVGSVGE